MKWISRLHRAILGTMRGVGGVWWSLSKSSDIIITVDRAPTVAQNGHGEVMYKIPPSEKGTLQLVPGYSRTG